MQSHGGVGRRAARGRLDQPVGEFCLLLPQSLEQPMHVKTFFGAQFIPDTPDFFDGAFLFQAIKVPSIPGACKAPEG